MPDPPCHGSKRKSASSLFPHRKRKAKAKFFYRSLFPAKLAVGRRVARFGWYECTSYNFEKVIRHVNLKLRCWSSDNLQHRQWSDSDCHGKGQRKSDSFLLCHWQKIGSNIATPHLSNLGFRIMLPKWPWNTLLLCQLRIECRIWKS